MNCVPFTFGQIYLGYRGQDFCCASAKIVCTVYTMYVIISIEGILKLCKTKRYSICIYIFQKRNGKTKGITKRTHPTNPVIPKCVLRDTTESVHEHVGEIVSPTLFHDEAGGSICPMSITSQSEPSCCNVAEDTRVCEPTIDDSDDPVGLSNIIRSSSEEQCDARVSDIICARDLEFDDKSENVETELSSGSCLTDAAAEFDHTVRCDELEAKSIEASSSAFDDRARENTYEGGEQLEVPESAAYFQQTDVGNGAENCKSASEFGDWSVVWDSDYMRNYFYNSKTQISTWYPPEGMEHLCDTNYDVNKTNSEPIEMDASETINASDVCILEDSTNLFNNPSGDDALLSQAFDEFFEGFGHSLSRNTEESDTLSETSGSCINGSMELLSSKSREYVVRY